MVYDVITFSYMLTQQFVKLKHMRKLFENNTIIFKGSIINLLDNIYTFSIVIPYRLKLNDEMD